MANDLTSGEPEDDGFDGSLSSLFGSSNYLRWTDAAGWVDRDGLPPPQPMLVLAVDDGLQRWKDNRQEIIRDKPLPDPAVLNGSIPMADWEKGIDGMPRPPWSHVVIICLIDPHTGRSYRYTTPTVGGRISYDELREAVVTMRALRGTRVVPAVNLSTKPFKTGFGMRKRPFFEIVGWKTPGGDDKVIAPKPTPQLTGPVTAPTPAPTPAPVAAPTTSAPTPAAPAQASPPASHSAPKPKPPVNLGGETLAAMANVQPVTMSEIMDDELPF
jgi:hypothetical protein